MNKHERQKAFLREPKTEQAIQYLLQNAERLGMTAVIALATEPNKNGDGQMKVVIQQQKIQPTPMTVAIQAVQDNMIEVIRAYAARDGACCVKHWLQATADLMESHGFGTETADILMVDQVLEELKALIREHDIEFPFRGTRAELADIIGEEAIERVERAIERVERAIAVSFQNAVNMDTTDDPDGRGRQNPEPLTEEQEQAARDAFAATIDGLFGGDAEE